MWNLSLKTASSVENMVFDIESTLQAFAKCRFACLEILPPFQCFM